MVTCLHPLAGIQSKPLGHVCRYSRSANTRKRETCAKGFFIGLTMTKPLDITGQRFGRLVAVRYAESRNGARWLCICDCGNESIAATRSLRYGDTRSCGCGAREQAIANANAARIKRMVPYPHSRKLKELIRNMIARCTKPDNKRWENYGGRGIKVCEEWSSNIREFYKWATENGYQPGLQIDRIDVNGNYEPGNCRFATVKEQMNNTTRNHFVEWAGERLTIAQWEDQFGWPRGRLQVRFNLGWTVERAMTQPPRKAPTRAKK